MLARSASLKYLDFYCGIEIIEVEYVIVPLPLGLLYVDQPRRLHGPTADFTRLPFFDGMAEVNANNAFLSEDIVCPTFVGDTTLEPGVHLHWQLPAALTRSFDNKRPDSTDPDNAGPKDSDPTRQGLKENDLGFPAAPNIWLVQRDVIHADGAKSRKRWVVQSDYLFPPGEGAPLGAICFPIGYRVDPDAGDGRLLAEPPFRYMGRVLPEADWHKLDEPHQVLADMKGHPLTALGFGDPTFASFYPNCRSVFGFTDIEPANAGDVATYSVTGWYRQAADDICAPGILDADFANRIGVSPDPVREPQAYAVWRDKGFSATLGWNKLLEQDTFPGRSIYVGRQTLDASHGQDRELDISVAAGNTATEALSSYLAAAFEGEQDIVEDRLEALHLLGELDHLSIDTGAKFEESRHARGFEGVAGGTLFRIVLEDGVKETGDADDDEGYEITLGFDLAHGLSRLNAAQRAVDHAAAQQISRQKRAFADWYKYMLCAYPPQDEGEMFPDADEVLFTIQREYFDTAKAHATALTELKSALEIEKAAVAQFLVAANALRKESTLVLKPSVAPRFWMPNDPVVLLGGPNMTMSVGPPLDALQVAGAAGDLLRGGIETLEETIDDVLADVGKPKPEAKGQTSPQTDAPTKARAIPKARIDPETATQKDTTHIPIMMEWEVEVWPHGHSAALSKAAGAGYSRDFLTSQYDLPEQAVDLVGLERRASREIDPSVFQGRSILSHHAKPMLIAQMQAFLDANLEPMVRASGGAKLDISDARACLDWWQACSVPDRMALRYCMEHAVEQKDRTPEWRVANDGIIAEWYAMADYADTDAFIDEILRLRVKVSPDFHAMAQSLTGFNAALAGQRQTLQMSVNDPLAFMDGAEHRSPYQSFALAMKTYIDGQNRTAPQPLWEFNPIRSGHMRLSRLVLIDRFGRRREIPRSRINSASVSRTLRNGPEKAQAGEFVLPPRFTQPVRLNMRWLSNGNDAPIGHDDEKEDIEANIHPASSPICGWIVPNTLDSSLSVFDERGKALGYLDLNGEWRAPPGFGALTATASAAEALALSHPPTGLIENRHLRRVVQWIETSRSVPGEDNGVVITAFQSALDNALEGVDPSDWAKHKDLALLMGRPIAVVRATLDFELQGLPNLDPGWATFRKKLQQGHDPVGDSGNIESLEINVRLGEHHQLNDGLLGFWKEWESDPGSLDLPPDFYSPQANADKATILAADKRIHCSAPDEGDNPFTLKLSLGGPARKVTMLVDPRGTLHATCGVVPTKNIRIPIDQYEDVLSKLEMPFFAAPVLSPIRGHDGAMDPIEMPVPAMAGYVWNWLEADGAHWTRIAKVNPSHAEADMGTRTAIREGWLQLRPAPKVSQKPKDAGPE